MTLKGKSRFVNEVMLTLVRHAVVGGTVCIGMATTTPVSAQSELAPVVIRPAREHPNCQIYLKADGARLLFKGKPISAGGSCPSDYLRGTLARLAAGSYSLKVSGADCTVTPTGLGPCR